MSDYSKQGYDIYLNREFKTGNEGLTYPQTSFLGASNLLATDQGKAANTATYWNVTGGAITAQGAGSINIKAGQTAYNTGSGFWLGLDAGVAKLSIGDGASSFLTFDGTTLTVSGSFSASSGSIGGFTIGADYMRDAGNSMGLASTVTGGDDVRFWAGDTFANRASAPFRVTEAGAVTGSSITITGGSVASSTLNGLVALSNLNIANRGWSQTSVFSVLGADNVQWLAGTLAAADGTAYSIGAGATGVMAAKTYIYLDTAVSVTAYQVTTTSTTAVGAGKILVAIAENGTIEASFQVVGGQGAQNIDASQIVAGSITANEIAASTITAAKMGVGQLSAIAADLGAVTAGTITLDGAGYVRGGQTDYETGNGYFLGYSGGEYKFSIGDADNFTKWDGSFLRVKGSITIGTGSILDNSVYTVAALPTATATVGFNDPAGYE